MLLSDRMVCGRELQQLSHRENLTLNLSHRLSGVIGGLVSQSDPGPTFWVDNHRWSMYVLDEGRSFIRNYLKTVLL